MTSGERESEFMQMLVRCRSTLFKVCLLFSDRQRESLKDLFQEIVCNLWEGYGEFRHDCSENTWVYRVALNTALNEQRRRMQRPHELKVDERLFDELADVGADEQLERLYELIGMLEEDERKLLLLYIDGVRQKEIGKMMGITEVAVGHRISRLKVKLKKMNEDEER